MGRTSWKKRKKEAGTRIRAISGRKATDQVNEVMHGFQATLSL